MYITQDQAIERIAQRTSYNTRDIRQKNRQRRNIPVDLYGIEYTRQGDGGTPATFYVSITPDMIYMERFEFKLIIQPFVSTVASSGIQSANVIVNDTNLQIANQAITPNPHDHDTQPHTHNVVSGVSLVHTTSSFFSVSIEGIDVSPYLMAQYGDWIDGEGVYPSLDIEKDYDVLEVASDLIAEGRESDADLLVKPGYKRIDIVSDAPFQVTLVLYLKLSHMNR